MTAIRNQTNVQYSDDTLFRIAIMQAIMDHLNPELDDHGYRLAFDRDFRDPCGWVAVDYLEIRKTGEQVVGVLCLREVPGFRTIDRHPEIIVEKFGEITLPPFKTADPEEIEKEIMQWVNDDNHSPDRTVFHYDLMPRIKAFILNSNG